MNNKMTENTRSSEPPITTDDLSQGAVLTDSRFSRFDQELIDKYFNDEGKEAIRQYVTQSNKDLLERVKSEVIGKDKVNHNHVWHTTADCGCTYFTEGDKANNELKAEQRSALQKIEEEL